MLVGRSREERAVGDLLARSFAGACGVACIEGAAGIGKSALIDAVASEASAVGASVIRARGDELAQSRPFGPLIGAGLLDVGLVNAAHGDAVAGGPSTVPSGESRRSGRARVAPLGGAPELRSLLIEQVCDRLERAADAGPLLLALDDAHWADDATLMCVAAGVRRCREAPVVVAVTYRPTRLDSPLGSFMRSLRTTVPAERLLGVRLEALDDDDVVALAEHIVGAAPAPSLRALLARCGGNPLLTVETITSLQRAGRIVTTAGAAERVGDDLPVSLYETVRLRMAPLEGEIRAVAVVAALLGVRFGVRDVALVTGRSVADVLGLVTELVGAGLVVDDGITFAFRHDLVRATVADLVPAGARRDVQRRIATALREAGEPLVRVAQYVGFGEPTDDRDRAEAIEVLQLAAAEVVTRDPSSAAVLLRRAAELSDGSPARDEVTAQLVDALAWSGRTDEARELAEHTLRRPVRPDVEEQLLSALVRALMLLGRPGDAVGCAARVVALLEPAGRPVAWARAQGAMCRLLAVDLDGALREAERAQCEGVAESDAMAEILALSVQAFALNTVGDTAKAIECGDRAVILADATPGGEGHRLHPHLFRGIAMQTYGDRAAATSSFREGELLGERVGATWALPIYHFVTALVHWDAGDWDDVLAEIEAGIRFGDDEGSTIARLWAHAVAALVHAHRGELAEADAAIALGEHTLTLGGLQFGIDWFVSARAAVAEARGDVDAAFRELTGLWETAMGLQADSALTSCGPDLARLARRVGRDDVSHAVAERLGAIASLHPADAIAGGRSLRARGLADDDVDALLQAVRVFESLGRPFEVAVIRVDAATLLGPTDPTAAVALLDRAIDTFDAVGAQPLASRVRRDVARLRPERAPRGARRRAATGWPALTSTERLVVDEVCSGRSNAQIAVALGISRRTVEAHLRSVYTKVGVRTRLELAVARRAVDLPAT